jgi:hypothetical protein
MTKQGSLLVGGVGVVVMVIVVAVESSLRLQEGEQAV